MKMITDYSEGKRGQKRRDRIYNMILCDYYSRVNSAYRKEFRAEEASIAEKYNRLLDDE